MTNEARSPVKIRIGINPLTWSNDDLPSLGAGNSLETCLREAQRDRLRRRGTGPQVSAPGRGARAAARSEHGLSLVSGWYSLRLLERDEHAEFEAMAAFRPAAQLGCEVMVACEVTGCIHGDIVRACPRDRGSRRTSGPGSATG